VDGPLLLLLLSDHRDITAPPDYEIWLDFAGRAMKGGWAGHMGHLNGMLM
jgi:hypothetical protein